MLYRLTRLNDCIGSRATYSATSDWCVILLYKSDSPRYIYVSIACRLPSSHDQGAESIGNHDTYKMIATPSSVFRHPHYPIYIRLTHPPW